MGIGRWAMVGLAVLLVACSSAPAPQAGSGGPLGLMEALAVRNVPGGFRLGEVRPATAEDLQGGGLEAQAVQAGDFVFTAKSIGAAVPQTTAAFIAAQGELTPQAGRFDAAGMKAATYWALQGWRNTVSNLSNPANHTSWMSKNGISLSNYDYYGEQTYYCNWFGTSCRMVRAWVKWTMTDRKTLVVAAWEGDFNTPAVHLEVQQYDKSGYGQGKVMFGNSDEVFIYDYANYYARYNLAFPRVQGRYLKGLTYSEKQGKLQQLFVGGYLSSSAGLSTLGFCIAPKPGQTIPDPGNMACPMNPGDVDVNGCPNCRDETNRYNKLNDALFKIENETIPQLNVDAGVAGVAGVSCVATIVGTVTVVAAPYTCGSFGVTLTKVAFQSISTDIKQRQYNRQLAPARNAMNACTARQNQCTLPPAPGDAEPTWQIVLDGA